MTQRPAIAAAAASLACLALAACVETGPGGLFDNAPRQSEALDLDKLIADPGVYAGQEITLAGQLASAGGQACLSDRGRRVAVRLTPLQARAYPEGEIGFATVRGVFTQNLCPPGYACPEFCAPYGLDAGAEIVRGLGGR